MFRDSIRCQNFSNTFFATEEESIFHSFRTVYKPKLHQGRCTLNVSTQYIKKPLRVLVLLQRIITVINPLILPNKQSLSNTK